MEILNIQDLADKEFGKRKSQKLKWYMPKPDSRIIINGESGSGKTNFLVNLLINGDLKYDRLYLYVKDFDCDEKWLYLAKHLIKLEKEYEKKYNTKTQILFTGNDADEFVTVEELPLETTNIIVVDDFVNDKRALQIVSDLFIRGRKRLNGGMIFFLTQSWYATPRVCRLNCSQAWLFKERDERDKMMVARDLSGRLPTAEFLRLYDEIHDNDPYGFMCVDLTAKDKGMRYRHNLTGLYTQPLQNESEK